MCIRGTRRLIVRALLLAALCSIGVLRAADLAEHDEAAEALFSNRQPVPHLRIDVSAEDMDLLRESRRSRDGISRPEVPATVREGTNVYAKVALHLKGSGGSFQPVDSKPALTLHFNEHVKGQRFHGLEKISLNNSVQDSTYLCEHVGRKLFAAAGIPAPRVTHATVTLNGRRLGLYVLAEGWNQQFLRRHFTDTTGNFYEPAFRTDVPGPFDVKSGAASEDHRVLEALAAAAREPDESMRWAALERTLDLDRFITGMALEILLNHWDGYCRGQNNYRLFHDRASDRIVFLPHGMDQLFALRRPEMDMSLAPPMRGRVATAVMGTSEGRWRYYQRTGWLLSNVFNVAELAGDVRAMAARLRPYLGDDPGGRAVFDSRVQRLVERIAERHAVASDQCAAATASLVFPGNKPVLLTDWSFRRGEGSPGFYRRDGGVEFLQLNSSGPSARGSWRTTVLLEPGRYRFEGRARIFLDAPRGPGMSPDAVTLRSSIGGTTRRDDEGGGAVSLTHEFVVVTKRYVDLICESAVRAGETEFEPASLKLARLSGE